MKLLSMKLINFKGIREVNFNFPDGGNYNIYGTNGAGKTTTVDALTWLLFDKDSTDAKDFNIKTIVDGEPLHHAEHSVECAFLMENGQTVTLKKVYKEKWQRPRGKLDAEFAGHTTEYYIDEVPTSASEFKKYINGIVDEKKFKVLTNPLYFNEKLKDAERRVILMDIIGGVDQDIVIAENLDELADLKPLLKGRKVEDYKLIVKQSLAKTKKEIDGIEPAIKEHQAMMIAGADASNQGLYENAVKRCTVEIENIIREIAKVKAGTVSTELEAQKAALNQQIFNVLARESQLDMEAKNELQAKLDEARKNRQEAENRAYGFGKIIAENMLIIGQCETRRDALLYEFNEVSKQKFYKKPIETICPTCGQEIQPEKVEEAKARQKEQERKFNLDRAEKLKAINAKGQANNEAKAEAEKKLAEAKQGKQAAEEEMMAKMDAEKKAKEAFAGYNGTILPEHEELEKKLAELEAQINQPDEAFTKRMTELEGAKLAKIQKQRNAEANLNDIAQNRKHQARINELQEKETELSATYTSLQRQSFLCDQYSRCLTDYIDRKVADKFKMARFVMFRDNITNDGAKECCEVQLHGTPYHDLCQTEQMHVGLDIINTLCRYYKMTMPVLIDRSESFITLPETDMQIIRLIVSADDKELRVEKA